MRSISSRLRSRSAVLVALMLGFSLAASPLVVAAEIVHNLYEIGSNRQNLLFRLKRTEEGGTIRNVFQYPDGKIAVNEIITLENGRVKSIRIEQLQTGEVYSADVRDGVVHYSRVSAEKTKESRERFPDNVLVGSQVVAFARSNWEALIQGESKPFRIVAVDRQETFGFKIFKEASESDEDITVLKMRPSSPFIAALVKPIVFRFDTKTRKIRSVVGRTTPKLLKGDKWVDLDAELVFD